jgi:pimeloyl-ACP methyl ester carboxylesterase
VGASTAVKSVGAGELVVERLGTSGPAVVMLHGWGVAGASLKPLGEILVSGRQVHILDLPGFGGSPMPSEVWGTYEYAKRVVAYLDEVGIEKAHLIGHSFGGRISLQLAIHFPERVASMVLMGAAGIRRHRPPKEAVRAWALRRAGQLLKTIDRVTGAALFRTYFAPRFGSADYQKAGALKPIFVKVVNEDLEGQVGAIRANTLLLWGSKDTETPPEMGHRFNALIRGSKYIELPGKDHYLFLGMGAHLCAEHIEEFLSAVERAGGGQQ